MKGMPESRRQRGFTLIELLVVIVVALVILAGLMSSFRTQYGEYKYQNRRVDAAQDLEFVTRFIADDIRSALVINGTPQIAITNNASGVTTSVTITTWEPDANFWGAPPNDAATNRYRAVRHYTYDPATRSLKYDRNTRDGNDAPTEILANVTDFAVMQDAPGVSPAGFVGAPAGLSAREVSNSQGQVFQVPAYTVLVEVAVPGGYRRGSFINARGVDVRATADSRKRVWRYVQAHPQAAGD